jgi:hypothetical protein
LILLLAFAGAVPAQRTGGRETDLQDTVGRQKDQVAKPGADVRNALREAQRLSATSATKAVERLHQALDQIDKDSDLSSERRQALKRLLKDRIRVLQMPPSDEDSSESRFPETKEQADEESRLTDQVRVLRLQAGLKKLVKQNKMAEGGKRIGQSAGNRPDNCADVAASRTEETGKQLRTHRQLQTERDRGVTRALRDVDKYAAPPKDEISYPADWKERTKNRSDNVVAMTDKEKAIFRALNSTVSVRFKDSRFEDVIEYIRTATGLTIALDKESMDEVGLRYDSTVSFDVKGVTARFLLSRILAERGLTFVIRNEVVEVVTPKIAKTLLVTRTYRVSDLSDSACGSFSSEEVGLFMNLIQTTIDPKSWKGNGGEGTITFNPVTRSVTIKQSAEFHGVLGGGSR